MAYAIRDYVFMVYGGADAFASLDEDTFNNLIKSGYEKIKRKQSRDITETKLEYENREVIVGLKYRDPKRKTKTVDKSGYFNWLARQAGDLLGKEDWGREKRTVEIPRKPKKIIETIPVIKQETEKVIGTEYLEGGYPAIRFLIKLGLGLQQYLSDEEMKQSLDNCLANTELWIERKLAPFKAKIKKLIQNKPLQAEQKLIEILEQALEVS